MPEPTELDFTKLEHVTESESSIKRRTEWLEQFIKNTEDLEGDWLHAKDEWDKLRLKAQQQRRLAENLEDSFREKKEIYAQITGHSWYERSWADA